MDAFLNQAEEISSCSHCTATGANVRKGMSFPLVLRASCVISWIRNGEVWHLPRESRPWRRLSSVPRTQFSKSLLHGPPQAASLCSLSSSISLPNASFCGSPSTMGEQSRSGQAWPYPSPAEQWVCRGKFASSALQRTGQTQNVGSLLWTPAGASLQCRVTPSLPVRKGWAEMKQGQGLLPSSVSSH